MTDFLHPDEIRTLFSRAMSDMYREEVPQYGTLCELVARTNADALTRNVTLREQAQREGQPGRLDLERHGAIRVGTASELATLRRIFAVMGMQAVGYYDLSVAGLPVHATAFRPVNPASLERNPFRVFTSLLRLDFITDVALRQRASALLAWRQIFTEVCLESLLLAERQGGLTAREADVFVREALETFRWHSDATVDIESYRQLRASHPLVADIVCFKGPHINHLTPRVLDIDAAHEAMPRLDIRAKDTIEGPPRRNVPILLRQTSFLALEEPIRFVGEAGATGTHAARFGEIEQRGCALTRKGRALYDELLAEAAEAVRDGAAPEDARRAAFRRFPDDLATLHRERLAFFHYGVDEATLADDPPPAGAGEDALVAGGWLRLLPQTYEDFLPVSAAGIFRSNLGADARQASLRPGQCAVLEEALGGPLLDEIALYERSASDSLATALRELQRYTAAVLER